MVGRMKVAVMCCDGLFQRHLVARVRGEFDLVGVLIHTALNSKGSLLLRLRRYRNPITLGRHIGARILLFRYQKQVSPLIKKLFYTGDQPPELPDGVPILHVADVNSLDAVGFLGHLSPDIVCVNGTNLLRKPMLDLIPTIPYGIINLHTGLSPYSRGGNCNLYMLLERHPEYVGVTIHHINEEIDGGDIITSARPELDTDDNYEMIDAKTFRLGIDLMLVAVRQLVQGRAQRVKQWEKGKLFLKRTGYVYSPYARLQANRLLKQGLIRDYLANWDVLDSGIRLVGKPS